MAVYLTVFWIEFAKDKEIPKYFGKRQPYEIEIESYDICDSDMSVKKASDSRPHSGTSSDAALADSLPLAQFTCGNPNIEKIEGIVHFYKENLATSLAENVNRPQQLCILNVPLRLTVRDFLIFIAPTATSLTGIRIVRRAISQSSYMVLLRFRSQEETDQFFQTYNCREYNSFEPETCNVVYVTQVEFTKQDSAHPAPNLEDLTELPICPVCLERMDESVEGVLTVLCNHNFHTACIQQCSDTTCPVCRCVLTPDFNPETTACSDCGATIEDLWICLICGNVGCGRYHGTHAYRHYEETQHLYSMHLNTGRVWDYAGDNYVHRLIQSKGDGKLVEVPASANNSGFAAAVDDEKVDAVTLEYTFLLTSQLESQRKYFEEKMLALEQMCHEQLASTAQEFTEAKRKVDELNAKIVDVKKEKEAIEQKYGHCQKLLAKVRSDLEEEKALNQSMRNNQGEYAKKVQAAEQRLKEETLLKDAEIKDLQDQLRDLLFHLESQQRLEESGVLTKDEMQNNQLIITDSPNTSGVSTGSASKGRRRKKSGTSSSK